MSTEDPHPAKRMTAATFRAMREYLGLSGAWLADQLKVSPRTVRKWDQGEAPIPAGVADEMQRLATMTREFVDREADRLRTHPETMGPFEIPRHRDDIAQMTPATDLPIDWWRAVGARLMEEIPGLWLDWMDFDNDLEDADL